MEGVDGFPGGKWEFRRDALGAAISGAVKSAVDGVGRADGFEDVDLSAAGPAHGFVTVAEQPESGPDAFAGGELNAGLETSVFLREMILRIEASGGEVARDAVSTGEVFFAGGDDKAAVLLLHVGGAGGVGFELVIPEALASGDDVPL